MGAEIVTFELFHGRKDRVEFAIQNPSSVKDISLPTGKVARGSVVARVDQGRWVADCPWCTGAELVSFDAPVFFCCECRNATVGHAYLQVTVPDDVTRLGVESALGVRPVPATRNWLPGETVADLVQENTDHGLIAQEEVL